MASWVTVSSTAKLSDVEPPKKGDHSFFSPKKMSWLSYCLKCGHIPLKNGISQLVTRLGCDYERNASYKAWLASGRRPL